MAIAFPLPTCVLPVLALPPLPPVAVAFPPFDSLLPCETFESFCCSVGDPLGPLAELLCPAWALLEAFELPP
jgi:hypothetical protein